MNICLIAPVPPFRGGIAKYCYSLAQELEKRHNLLLLSYKRQYPELLYGKKSQIDPDADRLSILQEFSNLAYEIDSINPLTWYAAVRHIIAFRTEMVILPWWVAYWAPMYQYLRNSLRKAGIKIVFICINVREHEDSILKNFLTRMILRKVDFFIVHSEQERRELLEITPRAEVRKHLLPLFLYDIPSEAKHDGTLKLLFFGFVRPYKGLDTLLQALAVLSRKDISLKIVGEFWNDKARYVELMDRLKISGQIEIIDRYVPDTEMGQYFCWADLVVLPYRQSITSGVIATAYGFRKPVLATNVGGFKEVIRDGRTGKMVAPNDPHALADGILWFLDNKQLNFAENIARFASQAMSWGSLADTIEEFNWQKRK